MTSDEQFWTRRTQLQTRSAELRRRLAGHTHALQPVWVTADRTRRVVDFARAHPWVPALALACVLLRRPRRALRWAWAGWQGWQHLSKWRSRWQAMAAR